MNSEKAHQLYKAKPSTTTTRTTIALSLQSSRKRRIIYNISKRYTESLLRTSLSFIILKRKQSEICSEAVSKIQKYWRIRQQQISHRNNAVQVIQGYFLNYFRAKQKQKNAASDASTLICAFWKGRQARIKAHLLRLQLKKEKEDEERKIAAILQRIKFNIKARLIQSRVRVFLLFRRNDIRRKKKAQKDEREKKQKEKESMRKTKNEYREVLDQLIALHYERIFFVKKIQALCRGYIERVEHKRMNILVIHIQRFVRGALSRLFLHRLENRARKIQSWWTERYTLKRQNIRAVDTTGCSAELNQTGQRTINSHNGDCSVIRIQVAWREFLQTKKKDELALKTIGDFIITQIRRKRNKYIVQMQNECAVLIQSHVRSLIAKKVVERVEERKLETLLRMLDQTTLHLDFEFEDRDRSTLSPTISLLEHHDKERKNSIHQKWVQHTMKPTTKVPNGCELFQGIPTITDYQKCDHLPKLYFHFEQMDRMK